MAHAWHATEALIPTPTPGEWRMYDGAKLVGYIQRGRLNGKPAFRGVCRKGKLEMVIGYEWTLAACAKEFWDWYILYGLPRD